jgi:hypothetical protein
MSTGTSMEQILATVRSFDGALVLAPAAGSDAPELAWGDYFFYHAPDGRVPHATQPYGTIVTKDYPDDTGSRLGVDGRWRVNVHVGRARSRELLGTEARQGHHDVAAPDVLVPHPVYGALGWVAVVTPGPRTLPTVLELLRQAHDDARARAERRADPATGTHGRDA